MADRKQKRQSKRSIRKLLKENNYDLDKVLLILGVTEPLERQIIIQILGEKS